MFAAVDTRDNASVEREARLVHGALFPRGDPSFVSLAFGWLLDCFEGRYPGYLPLDTNYHDTEHTMQVALCFVRLLRARAATRAAPRITQKAFELGLLAVLFHDSGYLKRSDDTQGTGAKYTATHVNRGAAFAAVLLRGKGFSADDTDALQKMIHCTAPDQDPRQIPFRNDVDRLVGYSVGTADLLGQMAAPDYVDKLPVLFGEFAEAARNAVAPMPSRYAFADSTSLLRETPAFWRDYAKPRLDVAFGRLYGYLNDPWPDGANAYVERIERNLERLRAELESSA